MSKKLQSENIPIDEIHIFNTDDPKKLNKHYASNLFPKLKIQRNNVPYEEELEVHFYSVEDNNKKLLHHLLSKTRSTKITPEKKT